VIATASRAANRFDFSAVPRTIVLVGDGVHQIRMAHDPVDIRRVRPERPNAVGDDYGAREV
jgi:hypothetical protein